MGNWKLELFKNNGPERYITSIGNPLEAYTSEMVDRLDIPQDDLVSDWVNDSLHELIMEIGGQELLDQIQEVDGWGIDPNEWDYEVRDDEGQILDY
jgi:hypothetical protein